jgi:hypothetical protein
MLKRKGDLEDMAMLARFEASTAEEAASIGS